MATIRNLRPRVLTAIYSLGTFTISELCHAARLTDRGQAYAQLDRLKKLGYVEEQTLPASAAHAPFKEYRLVSDAGQRKKFAEELAGYQVSPPEAVESDMARLALDEAGQDLDKIERSLAGIENDRAKDSTERLSALDAGFDAAWTNIQTAQLESAGQEGARAAAAAGIAERWRKADAKRTLLKNAQENQPATLDWAPVLRVAAKAVSGLISPGKLSLDDRIEELSRNLNGEFRAPVEMLLDEIRAGRQYPFSPVFRQALRTGDAKVLFDVVDIFKDVDLAWWNYNRENACYLKTSKLRVKEWLKAYEALREGVPFRRGMPFQVYSYALESLTKDMYLRVTRDQCVSLVSPRKIGFLGMSEVVRPTLIVESGSTLRPLECTFLKPDDSLHAYGPIANDIACWQGAPGLRVAACLGMWGLPLDGKLLGIVKLLKGDRGLLVAQGKTPRLAPETVTSLEAEEVGGCVCD